MRSTLVLAAVGYCLVMECAGSLLWLKNRTTRTKQDVPPNCDPNTYQTYGYEDWTLFGVFTCTDLSVNPEPFCQDPASTMDGNGVTVTEACCLCASPTPSSSITATSSRSATASQSISRSSAPSQSATNSLSATASVSTTASISVSVVFTSSPSLTQSPSSTPSISVTASNSKSRSVSASVSPSISVSPSFLPELPCPDPIPDALCANQASVISGAIEIGNEGALGVVAANGMGSVLFDFSARFPSGIPSSYSLWAKARCTGFQGSGAWQVAGVSWDIQTPSTDTFSWQPFGTLPFLPIPHMLLLEMLREGCELRAVFVGQTDGELLATDDGCDSGPNRGYLCPSETLLNNGAFLLPSGVLAFNWTSALPTAARPLATLEFPWRPDLFETHANFSVPRLWAHVACPRQINSTWDVGGDTVVVQPTVGLEWVLLTDSPTVQPKREGTHVSISVAPIDSDCFISHFFLGFAAPATVFTADCPSDEAKCPNEGSFVGTGILGLNSDVIIGSPACREPNNTCSESSVTYHFGTQRGYFWVYTNCSSGSWIVNDQVWHLSGLDGYTWARFGNDVCDNIVLKPTNSSCHIAMLYRGYGEPFEKQCTCPWSRQQIYVVENQYFNQISRIDGQTLQSTVCATGFVHVAQIAADPLGNLYVADISASAVYRVAAGCGAKTTVVSWPTNSIAQPSAIACHNETLLFVADASSGLVYGLTVDAATGILAGIQTAPLPPLFYTSLSMDGGGTLFAAAYKAVVYWNVADGFAGGSTASGLVHQLVSPSGTAWDISDIALLSQCPGLYFTTFDNSQVWYCADRTNPASCNAFCVFAEGSSSCELLHGPSGIALDCQCQPYVVSNINGNLARYSAQGEATVLSSALNSPQDIVVVFDDSIYGDNCCHTPIPTPTPAPASLVRLTTPCAENVNCFHGQCQDGNMWCQCYAYAYGCQCNQFYGYKPTASACSVDLSGLLTPEGFTAGCCTTNTTVFFVEVGAIYTLRVNAVTMQVLEGPTLCAQLVNPTDIKIDSLGGLFVTDPGRVVRIAPGCGEISTVSQWPYQPIADPKAILIANNGLYVSDIGKGTVWFVLLGSDFTTVKVEDTKISTLYVSKISMSPHGEMYIVESGNSIFRYNPTTGERINYLTQAAGVVDISDLTVSSCGAYFTANDNNQVWRCSDLFDASSCRVNCEQNTGQDASSCYDLMNPFGIAVDCNCQFYVSSKGTGHIYLYSNSSDVTTQTHTTLFTTDFPLQDVEVLVGHECGSP